MRPADATREAQPLWAAVPVEARARYIRRAAIALLDLLVELGQSEAIVMDELLPAARGLHALADQGPRALADRRAIPRRARLVGRDKRLIAAPVGVVGLRGDGGWLEPALETGAALLAGNAVVLENARLRGVFLRAGVPAELIAVGTTDGCDRHIDLAPLGEPVHVLLRNAPQALVKEALTEVGGKIVAIGDVPPDAPVSLWAGDAAQAERVARTLPNRHVMIGRYRPTPMPPAERIQQYVTMRQLEQRAPWAPELPQTAKFQTALAELRHGREARRWPAIKALVRAQREER